MNPIKTENWRSVSIREVVYRGTVQYGIQSSPGMVFAVRLRYFRFWIKSGQALFPWSFA